MPMHSQVEQRKVPPLNASSSRRVKANRSLICSDRQKELTVMKIWSALNGEACPLPQSSSPVPVCPPSGQAPSPAPIFIKHERSHPEPQLLSLTL